MDRNRQARDKIRNKVDKQKEIARLEGDFEHYTGWYKKLQDWFKDIPRDTEDKINNLKEDKEGYEIMLDEGYEILDPKFKFEKSDRWIDYQVKTIERKISVIDKSILRIRNELSDETKKRLEEKERVEQHIKSTIEELQKLGIEKEFNLEEKKVDYIG